MNAGLFHTNDSIAQPESVGMVDLRNIWSIFRRRWRVFSGSVASTLCLTIVWLLIVTPIYTATTTLLIDPRKTNAIKSEAIVSDLALDVNTIATEVSLIKSFSVSRRVAERLHLQDNASFAAPQGRGLFRWIGGMFSDSPDTKKRLTESEKREPGMTGAVPSNLSPTLIDIIERVQTGINVHRVATTYFIEVSFSHTDPELAATLANSVAEAYLNEQLETRYQAAQRAATWLSDRVAALRVQLETSERSLAEHRSKYNLANPQAGTLAEQQAAEINAQLVMARAQTVEKKAKYEQAKRILDGGAGIESVPAVMESTMIGTLRVQEATIARQEADLLTRYGPKHPTILKIRAEHADVNRQIKREISRVVEALKADYDFAQKKEASLESTLGVLTGHQNLNNPAIIRLRELERDVALNRTLYETLLARFKDAEQQTSLKIADSRIIAPAFVPNAPSHPKKGLFLLLAIVAGVMLGTAAISLLEYLENGFTAATQLEQALDLPLLTVVPMLNKEVRRIDGKITSVPEYALLKPRSSFGESIRSARMMTQMFNDEPPKLVLITSSVTGEGKTTIATSLALSAAAASGQRVLLIDCDLRVRSTSKLFNIDSKPGLTNFLTKQADCEQVVFRTNFPNLNILPAGNVPGHPPDILESEQMHTLLQALRDSYDIIYVDAPPLLPVVDSVMLSQLADRIVFVVRWRATPRNIVFRATQIIENSRQKISGVVLNGAHPDQLMSYDPYNVYCHKQYKAYYVQ